MTYIRSKMINGCGPYYYEVRSQREGKTVRQIFVRYVGKHPGKDPSDSVVPNIDSERAYTTKEEWDAKAPTQTWLDRERKLTGKWKSEGKKGEWLVMREKDLQEAQARRNDLDASKNVVPKTRSKGHLEVEGAEDRKIPKTWDKTRRRRAEMIARVTKSNPFQADGLAKIAWRSGADPDKVNWDELQGADLSYDEKVEKLEKMLGSSAKTEKEYTLQEEQWLEDQADRRRYREDVEA